jgi:hypothetical protein
VYEEEHVLETWHHLQRRRYWFYPDEDVASSLVYSLTSLLVFLVEFVDWTAFPDDDFRSRVYKMYGDCFWTRDV